MGSVAAGRRSGRAAVVALGLLAMLSPGVGVRAAATAKPARPRWANSTLFRMPLADSQRARRYMVVFDRALARAIAQFDAERGLVKHTVPVGSPGVGPEVALLDRFERQRYVSPLNDWEERVGRSSASTICAMALAYTQPLSTYHRDPRLLHAIRNGLRAFAQHQGPSGEFVFTPLRYATIYGSHAMAWWLEDLLTAWYCVADKLPPAERARYWAMLDRAMRFLQATPCDSASNRGMVWTAVISMCWRATGDASYRRAADRMWDRIRQPIFQTSGEVMEGGGPCSNYSPVSMEYLLRYRRMTGGAGLDAVALRAVDWMAEMYTDRGVPLLGVSTRYDLQDGRRKMMTMLPALEELASQRPWYRPLADVVLGMAETTYGQEAMRNGAIGWLSAASVCGSAVPAAQATRAPWLHHYEHQATDYWTVGSGAYQAMLVLRGVPPRKGLQTWAVTGSSPFLFPEPGRESTVLAWGMDLAARDVSLQDSARSDTSALPTVTARHGRLWVTYIVSPRTLVVVHTLPEGERDTLWRGSKQYTVRFRLASTGDRVEAEGAAGALRWWGTAPTISEDGLEIRFRDASPTQVYAFASGAMARGADLPAERRSRVVSGDAQLVEWTDQTGHFVALSNHTPRAMDASVALPDGTVRAARLVPGQARVWQAR